MMKQKDIFYLGVAILEFMIGRQSEEKSNISLESLPSAWENCAEATALVQTLVQCVDLN